MGAATPRSRKVGVVINSPSAPNRTRGITHAKWGPRTPVGGVSPHSTRRGTRRGVKKWSRDINAFGSENPSPETYRAFARAPWPLHRSEEHTSELQSLMRISYAVFCLKKKNNN